MSFEYFTLYFLESAKQEFSPTTGRDLVGVVGFSTALVVESILSSLMASKRVILASGSVKSLRKRSKKLK